jgi:hypothetical protein
MTFKLLWGTPHAEKRGQNLLLDGTMVKPIETRCTARRWI